MVETASKAAVASYWTELRHETARSRAGYWFCPRSCSILGLGIFPLISSLALSFQRWDLQSQEHPFVGLANYRDALLDPRVWNAFANTGLLVVARSGSSSCSGWDWRCSSSATSRASGLRCRS